jgi:hypothetical protein
MTQAIDIPPVEDYNLWSDFWYYTIGVNVIPAHTKKKKTFIDWKRWQTEPIPEELHDRWKKENRFADDMAIIVGKSWRYDHIGEYWIFVDLDNLKTIEEFCDGQGKPTRLVSQKQGEVC